MIIIMPILMSIKTALTPSSGKARGKIPIGGKELPQCQRACRELQIDSLGAAAATATATAAAGIGEGSVGRRLFV